MNVFYFLSSQPGWKDRARVWLAPPPSPPLSFPEEWDTLSGNGIALNTKGLVGSTCGKKKCTQVCKCVCAGESVAKPFTTFISPPPPSEPVSPILCFRRLFFWTPIAAPLQEELKKKKRKKSWSSIHLRWVIDGSTVINPKQAGNILQRIDESSIWTFQTMQSGVWIQSTDNNIVPACTIQIFFVYDLYFDLLEKQTQTSSHRRSHKHLPDPVLLLFFYQQVKTCFYAEFQRVVWQPTTTHSVLPQPSGFRPAAVFKSLAVRRARARTDQRLSAARALVSQPSLFPPMV